ncbi:MAG: TonB-dependent receptor [Sphingobacteriales bacterium]
MAFFTFSKSSGRLRTLNRAARAKVFARIVLGAILLLSVSLRANAQIKVTGKVIDADTKEPLIGATILVKGTTTAASAGLDGSFKINVPSTEGTVLVVSYISYITQEIPLSGKTNLGAIILKSSSTAMNEVVITGDVAIDRKTPVAVTSLGPDFIENHVSNGDIPDLIMGVPGVMTTQGDGGYGDGTVSIRGFSSRSGNGNVAYVVNGIPISDPETGAIYWSDFTGITDVARSVQVQRGLGASKIIVPSFGGTVNVTTRTTDQQAGGFVSEGIGSLGYNKTSLMISTGLTADGWAATIQGSREQGAYPFDGSNYLGYNYFLNLSKVLTPHQTIALNVIGNTQTHGQRPEQYLFPNGSAGNFLAAPQGTAWNEWYGYKDGKTYNAYNNFYSEPIISINHNWVINEKSSLSTVLYGIFGSGGGGGLNNSSNSVNILTVPRSGGIYTPINYSALEGINAQNANGAATWYAQDAHSQTDWYGLRSTYRTLLGKYIDFQAGVDLRYYQGDHSTRVDDLFGASYVAYPYTGNAALGKTGGNINDPTGIVGIGGTIDYHNIDYMETGGVFAQAEYSKNDFSAFITAAGSENADSRRDPFDYLNGDPLQKSHWVNFTTYQLKGGANYNLNPEMNVFANIGYLTKPPYFGNVFEKFTNQINSKAVNEKLFDYELGYQFKTSAFSAKVSAYRMSYMDRAYTNSYSDATTNQLYSVNISGVNEMHEGVELELSYRPVQPVLIGGMLSIGDYYYTSNAGPATAYNNQGQPVANSTLSEVFLKNQKITDIAQNLFQGYVNITVAKQLRIGATVNYYSNYTAYVPFNDYSSAGLKPYKVPDYAIWGLNSTFKFKMAGFDASLIGNVNNLLNSKVIDAAEDFSANGNPSSIVGYWLNARTFTTTLKIKF